MPYSDECKDGEIIDNCSRLAPQAWHTASAEWDVQVPQAPLIEAAMPSAPKLQHGVVIAHTTDHVLWRIDTVKQCPEPEEAPGDEQFQPDMLEIEESEHAELCGCVLRPVRLGVEDGNHVHVVDHEFHRQKDDDEAYSVHCCALRSDAVWAVALLRSPVVEGEDGTGEVERRVHGVSEIVAEGEVLGFRRDGHAVALGEVGGVELFLLEVISLINEL